MRTSPSSLPLTARPTWNIALTAVMPLRWPSKVPLPAAAARSQTRRRASEEPLTARRTEKSALTEFTQLGASKTARQALRGGLARSQMRKVPSSEPLTACCLRKSAFNVQTVSQWPSRTRTHFMDTRSQRQMAPSAEPLTARPAAKSALAQYARLALRRLPTQTIAPRSQSRSVPSACALRASCLAATRARTAAPPRPRVEAGTTCPSLNSAVPHRSLTSLIAGTPQASRT
mmetsp:Transcript_115764/g.360547  ORF Transcript_115764/g.360547 Transcript_115764/m.360547 type:complete len:231 (-) Transcript_115764:29-721(-)